MTVLWPGVTAQVTVLWPGVTAQVTVLWPGVTAQVTVLDAINITYCFNGLSDDVIVVLLLVA